MARPEGALPAQFAELAPDSWTTPFWTAAREHRLVVPKCTNCGTYRFPPGPFCYECQHQDVEFAELPGTGTIYTFTIARHAVVPELKDHVPYVIAVIEPDGAPAVRLVANILESDLDAVSIGSKVAVVWDETSADVTVPRFKLTSQAQPIDEEDAP